MKKTNKLVVISNIASVVLIAALAVMQFMPFWYTVNGVHMTPAEYEAYVASEPYVYTGEKVVLEEAAPAPEASEPATDASEPATEASESATEASEPATEASEPTAEASEPAAEASEPATDASEPATDASEQKKPTMDGYYVLKCYACDTEQNVNPTSVKFTTVKNLVNSSESCRGCKSKNVGYAVLGEIKEDEFGGEQLVAWEDRVERSSIAQRVWFPLDGAPILMLHVWTLLFGAVCVYFCILRANKTISFIPVIVLALLNTLGYLKPEAMTGSLWIVHMILTCLLFVPGLILFVFWLMRVKHWFFDKQ